MAQWGDALRKVASGKFLAKAEREDLNAPEDLWSTLKSNFISRIELAKIIKIDMREWLSGRALPCLRNWKANNYYQQNKQNSYSPYHFPDKSTRTLYTKNLIKQIKQRHAGVAQW